MALGGEIKEFGVSDILQLITQQQKTGILLVEKKDIKAEIYFKEGDVAATRSPLLPSRDPLGEMLVRARVLTPDNLKLVLEKQKKTYGFIGQILLQEGFVDEETLERTVLTQTYETFYDILQWRDGVYNFSPEEVDSDPTQSSIPGLETILLDVLRMIDEWPSVEKRIISFDALYGKVEGIVVEELDPDEARVYKLIDSINTVGQIIQRSLLTRFATCKTLIDFLDDGMIELLAAKAKTKGEGEGFSLQRIAGPVSYAAVFVVLGVLVLLPTQFPLNILPVLNPGVLGSSAFQDSLVRKEIQRLETAVEVFRFQTGGYPQSITDLVENGILRDDDMQSFNEKLIIYSREGKSYSITCNDSNGANAGEENL